MPNLALTRAPRRIGASKEWLGKGPTRKVRSSCRSNPSRETYSRGSWPSTSSRAGERHRRNPASARQQNWQGFCQQLTEPQTYFNFNQFKLTAGQVVGEHCSPMHSGQASSQDSMGECQPGSHSSLFTLTSDSLAHVLQLLRPADLARLVEMQVYSLVTGVPSLLARLLVTDTGLVCVGRISQTCSSFAREAAAESLWNEHFTRSGLRYVTHLCRGRHFSGLRC